MIELLIMDANEVLPPTLSHSNRSPQEILPLDVCSPTYQLANTTSIKKVRLLRLRLIKNKLRQSFS